MPEVRAEEIESLAPLNPSPPSSSSTVRVLVGRQAQPDRREFASQGFLRLPRAHSRPGWRASSWTSPGRYRVQVREPAFTPAMLEELWLQTFPVATVIRLPEAEHYLQQDTRERIVPGLPRFLAANGTGSPGPFRGAA